MRIPRLARHTGIYIVVPVIQRGVYFLLLPVFTHFLSPSDYGAWGYISVVGAMIGTFAPLGLSAAYAYVIRRPQAWRAPADRVRVAALKGSFVLVALAAALTFPLVRRVDLGISDRDPIWIVMLSATVIGYLVALAKRRFQMTEQARSFAGVELTTGLTTVAVSFVGVAVLGWSVMGLAVGAAVGTVVGLVPTLIALRTDLRAPVDTAALKEALIFGMPLFFHAGAAILLQYVDRFMLERLSTLTELGLYSLAGQLATAMTIVTASVNSAYTPFLYRHFDTRPAHVARAQRYVALFLAAVGLVGVLIVPPFIRYFVDARFAASSYPTQLLLVGGVFHGFYYLAVGRLMVIRRTVTVAAVTIVCTALNIALNFWLIPRLHAEGAAWATLASEFALFLGMWFFSRGALSRPVPAENIDELESSAST